MAGAKKYPQFLLLGDSIIQFGYSFAAGLSEHCDRRLDVINHGLSGYTTAHELVVLDHPGLIPSPSCAKVDYLLLLFGANDASFPNRPSSQHVPIEKYRQYLKTIITHPSITAHNPTILLVTPPPLNEVPLLAEDLKKGYPALTRQQKVTAQYADAVRGVAEELKDRNVVLVDLWSAIMKEGTRLTPGFVEDGVLLGSLEKGDSEGLRYLLRDGLHLSDAGYKVFLGIVVPHVGQGWAEEPFDNPKWIFPHWLVAPRVDRDVSTIEMDEASREKILGRK